MGGASCPSVLAATSTAAALVGGITDFFHQRDGEGPGGDDIGDTGSGDQTGQSAAHDGGLGRPALEAAQKAEGQLDKILSGAGLVQHGAEKNEQKNNGGRNIQGNAVDPFGGHGHLPHKAVQGGALERRSDPACKGRKRHREKSDGDDRKCRPDDAPGRFQQQNDQDTAR